MITVHTNKAPAAIGPYSQAIINQGLVYTSGQIAINPETSNIEATTIEDQTPLSRGKITAIAVEHYAG